MQSCIIWTASVILEAGGGHMCHMYGHGAWQLQASQILPLDEDTPAKQPVDACLHPVASQRWPAA